jgi:hypothetical protein
MQRQSAVVLASTTLSQQPHATSSWHCREQVSTSDMQYSRGWLWSVFKLLLHRDLIHPAPHLHPPHPNPFIVSLVSSLY